MGKSATALKNNYVAIDHIVLVLICMCSLTVWPARSNRALTSLMARAMLGLGCE